MDFYWKNDLETNTFENFSRGDGFSLTANNREINKDDISLMPLKGNENNIRYTTVDFTKRDFGWNGAVSEINKLRDKLGIPPYPFSYVTSGECLTAAIFNEAREAINPVLPYLEQYKTTDLVYGFQYLDMSIPTIKHTGEIVNADYFNQIAEILSIEKLAKPEITEIKLIDHMPELGSTWGENKLTGESFPYILIGKYTVQYSITGSVLVSLRESISFSNGGNYVINYGNEFCDLFLNIIPHPKYGAIFHLSMDPYGQNQSIGWFAVPPETLKSGTFGITGFSDCDREAYSTDYWMKDLAGGNWIVHNEVPGLQVVIKMSSENKAYPRIRCYGDITYAIANEGDIDEFEYPILPFSRYGRCSGYTFPMYKYNGCLYLIGKDKRIHKYDPTQEAWEAACNGAKFDLEGVIGPVKNSFVYENYIYFWPNKDFGDKTQWMGSYWLVVGYHEPYLYRINLDGIDNTIERVDTTFVGTGQRMSKMDRVMTSITKPNIVYSTYIDGNQKTWFFITDLKTFTCDIGFQYDLYYDGHPFYVEHWTQNWTQHDYLQGCEYFSDMNKIIKIDTYFYYFDYHNTFKRYDSEGFYWYYEKRVINGVIVDAPYRYIDGVKVLLDLDAELRPLRLTLDEPPEPLDCPILFEDGIYAMSLDSIGTRLYKYNIGNDSWSFVSEVPLRY